MKLYVSRFIKKNKIGYTRDTKIFLKNKNLEIIVCSYWLENFITQSGSRFETVISNLDSLSKERFYFF
jgi:hypothetical protein